MRAGATSPVAQARWLSLDLSARMRSWRASDRLLIALLVVLSSAPYLNSLWNGFVYDDNTQILTNPFIRDFSHLKAIFTSSVWVYAGGARGVTDYYRPLMTLTYLLCHELFGYNAYGYHFVSLLLNAAVVVLMFFVTKRIFANRGMAFLAAAIFAIHPIHTEAVDWIAAVTDLELALFSLLVFWFFLRLGDKEARGAGRTGLIQLGMGASFVLALLSKEPAATLPLLAVIYEHACREDRGLTSWTQNARRYGALWILLGAYLLLRLRFLGAFAPVRLRANMPPATVFLSAVALAGHYLEKILWPLHLCAYYVFPSDLSAILPHAMAGAVALVACALFAIWLWRSDRRAFFGVVWFFIILAPVLNPRWMPPSVFAERYLYLPSVGFCWVAAWLTIRLWRRVANAGNFAARRGLAAAACAAAAICIALVIARNADWKDNLTFYARTIAASPRAGAMYNNLGKYYWDRGELRAAANEWQKALELDPDAGYVLHNLGLLRVRQGRPAEAVVFFERALAHSARDVQAHTGLGEAYEKMGRRRDAESQLRTAVALAPLDVRPRVLLGELEFDEGNYNEAKEQFEASLRALPTLRGYFGLGLIAWVKGDSHEAEKDFSAAQRLDPASSRPYFMLGLLDGAAGRTADAIREYEAGLKIDPTNKTALAALAKLKSSRASHHQPADP
ncbi:MAG: tetratricopeptide repeat protein [Terriglobia bacterium]